MNHARPRMVSLSRALRTAFGRPPLCVFIHFSVPMSHSMLGHQDTDRFVLVKSHPQDSYGSCSHTLKVTIVVL
jgi:hypothetical protein